MAELEPSPRDYLPGVWSPHLSLLPCSLLGPENPGVREASMNCLDFWKKPHSRKVTMINSIFLWSLHPWQEWERVVTLSLVRVGTLEKDWLGAGLPGNASFPPLTRHILKPLTLSGPTLTWHTGTCLSPPIYFSTLVKPSPPKSDSILPSSRKLSGN